MYKLLILSVVATVAVAYPVIPRVVNGTDAKPGEIPYIISLRSYNSHSCGGSIVDSTHVLTAAHCVQYSSASSLSIQYGVTRLSRDVNVIGVKTVTVHEDYSPWNNYANDVAVLELVSSIPEYSDLVQPTNLPQQDETPPGGQGSVLAGWGYPYSGGSVMQNLQRVDLILYTDADCSKAHGSSVNAKYHVCSGVPEGGKGQCSGDSGGPLYAEGKQWGVVSWSVKPCTIKGYPGVYARVSSYVDWINSKL